MSTHLTAIDNIASTLQSLYGHTSIARRPLAEIRSALDAHCWTDASSLQLFHPSLTKYDTAVLLDYLAAACKQYTKNIRLDEFVRGVLRQHRKRDIRLYSFFVVGEHLPIHEVYHVAHFLWHNFQSTYGFRLPREHALVIPHLAWAWHLVPSCRGLDPRGFVGQLALSLAEHSDKRKWTLAYLAGLTSDYAMQHIEQMTLEDLQNRIEIFGEHL